MSCEIGWAVRRNAALAAGSSFVTCDDHLLDRFSYPSRLLNS